MPLLTVIFWGMVLLNIENLSVKHDHGYSSLINTTFFPGSVSILSLCSFTSSSTFMMCQCIPGFAAWSPGLQQLQALQTHSVLGIWCTTEILIFLRCIRIKMLIQHVSAGPLAIGHHARWCNCGGKLKSIFSQWNRLPMFLQCFNSIFLQEAL